MCASQNAFHSDIDPGKSEEKICVEDSIVVSSSFGFRTWKWERLVDILISIHHERGEGVGETVFFM